MKILGLVLVLGAACTAHPVPVFIYDASATMDVYDVADGLAWWGLEAYENDTEDGSLTVFLTDGCATYNDGTDRVACGLQIKGADRCHRFAWIGNRIAIEHEIGHAFGLGHSLDSGNVMNSSSLTRDSEFEASADQEETVAREAEKLADCWDPK